MNKPVWKKVSIINEKGWYWDGGVGDTPHEKPQLIYYSPRTFYDSKWLAKAEDPVLPEIPRPALKIDDPVLVRPHIYSEWLRRYFAGWDNDGSIMVWLSGRTSWSANDNSDRQAWEFWKLPEEENE